MGGLLFCLYISVVLCYILIKAKKEPFDENDDVPWW